ncbi:MAG: hypothetical protein M3P24_12255, partial [Gemmatimonadota bacterium]|nr:hypothetical protein [Gemmatimonadota bacterium]
VGEGEPTRLVVSPDGDRLALVLPEEDGGIARLVDARTDRVLRSSRPGTLDAAFAPDGSLWLLRADEIRVASAR